MLGKTNDEVLEMRKEELNRFIFGLIISEGTFRISLKESLKEDANEYGLLGVIAFDNGNNVHKQMQTEFLLFGSYNNNELFESDCTKITGDRNSLEKTMDTWFSILPEILYVEIPSDTYDFAEE